MVDVFVLEPSLIYVVVRIMASITQQLGEGPSVPITATVTALGDTDLSTLGIPNGVEVTITIVAPGGGGGAGNGTVGGNGGGAGGAVILRCQSDRLNGGAALISIGSAGGGGSGDGEDGTAGTDVELDADGFVVNATGGGGGGGDGGTPGVGGVVSDAGTNYSIVTKRRGGTGGAHAGATGGTGGLSPFGGGGAGGAGSSSSTDPGVNGAPGYATFSWST
jgi:hypothetical protein